MRGGTPVITNDGVTIAKDIFLVDEIEDLGARVMREVTIQTNDKVGDGITAAMVLAQAILKKGLENMGDKADVISDHTSIHLKQTIDAECAAVVEKLAKSAKQIKAKEDLRNGTRVSAENEALALADTFFELGKEGVISVEENSCPEIEIAKTNGLRIDNGFIPPTRSTCLTRLRTLGSPTYW